MRARAYTHTGAAAWGWGSAKRWGGGVAGSNSLPEVRRKDDRWSDDYWSDDQRALEVRPTCKYDNEFKDLTNSILQDFARYHSESQLIR